MPAPDENDWRKRRANPGDFPGFPGFPAGFEQEFERMRQEMERMMQDLMRGGFPFGALPGMQPGGPVAGAKPGEPVVYGFTMRMGPDGRPHFQQFGNARPGVVAPGGVEGAREPLTDVLEGEKEVAVTVELPGASKEDINLHVADERITLRVEGAGRKYYKEIALPARVVPKTANATFKNGVLDITIQREAPAGDPGYRVDVR